MRSPSLLSSFAYLLPLLVTLHLTGCDSGADSACAPGLSIACVGAEGCEGYQVCNDRGSGYDPCTCGQAPTPLDSGVFVADAGTFNDAANMSPSDAGTLVDAGESSDSGTTPPAEDSGTSAMTDAGPAPDPSSSDDVYGTLISRDASWWIGSGNIYYGSEERTLRGLNWFGLDGTDHALHGLWASIPGATSASAKIDHFLDLIQGWGFNAMRVPLSPESLAGATPQSWGQDPAWTDSRGQLEYLLQQAASRNIWILLDMHTCAASAGHLAPSPESCTGYSRADWIRDLEDMASLATTYNNVVGIDLFNEPYGPTWDNWRTMVNEAARAVLTRNPSILIFVEGVGGSSAYGSYQPFYGENLYEAVSNPIDVPASRLVYTPHAYGPSVFEQPYFSDPTFPANMPGIWDEHFGFLRDANYVLAPGEFGGRYTGDDRTWQDAFVNYMVTHDIRHFFYWCLNPNSGDTGGLLLDDWTTPDTAKLSLLAPLLSGS